MDKQIQEVNMPDYKRIYNDIIIKYPQKKEECYFILQKEKLSLLDVIKLNQKIFSEKENDGINQKHRSYDKSFIIEILSYQKQNKMSNKKLATHFGISRNTITKWKKIFQV
jgi:DNA-binding transcriptional regulator YiaG